MGEADVHKALEGLVQLLDAHGIPYAIAGTMALNEFGYQRTTADVNVLLTGGFPGDSKPKPVAFKPASCMTAPRRLKDLADVQELTRILRLPKRSS